MAAFTSLLLISLIGADAIAPGELPSREGRLMMTILRRLFVLMVFYAGTMIAEGNAAAPLQPLIVAHRGLLRHAPENTLANYRACLELRIGFEFDVERTNDGHLVCIHDDTVDRTTNGKGKVAGMTLDEIHRLDAGSWFDAKFAGEKVPTVEEVLKLVAEYKQHEVLIAVDLKAEHVGQDVVRLAEKHKVLHRILVCARRIHDQSDLRGIHRSATVPVSQRQETSGQASAI